MDFLDEVGDIPIEIQPKLLRALQEREFERLGSTHTRKVTCAGAVFAEKALTAPWFKKLAESVSTKINRQRPQWFQGVSEAKRGSDNCALFGRQRSAIKFYTMATRRHRNGTGGDGNAWGSRGKDAPYLHKLCGVNEGSDRTLLLSFAENIRKQKKSRPE